MTTFLPNVDLHQKVANCFMHVPTDMRFAYAIRATFMAMPSSALALTRIVQMVSAIDGRTVEVEDVRKALSLLVRNGALRSRKNTAGGVRVWEVNYLNRGVASSVRLWDNKSTKRKASQMTDMTDYMTDAACRLNVMVNGDCVFQQVYPDYVAMMDDARAQRDKVQDENVGGFVVAQYQNWGPHGWFHGAILS